MVPFRGDRAAAGRLRAALDLVDAGPADELIVADNSDDGSASQVGSEAVRVAPARAERSSYHSRNVGAALAGGEWLLFMDADCIPAPGLLDAYFADPIPQECGALSGAIVGDPAQRGLLARYARSRNFLSVDHGLLGPDSGATFTGNLMIRRAAFEALGGFPGGIRSGGDIDLSRRLRAAGWSVERRPGAVVAHRDRESLVGFLGMIARYGAGARWLDQRYPGSSPRWPLLMGLRGAGRDIAGLLGQRRFEAALFRAIDGLGLIAHNVGYLASNRARAW